MILPLHLHSFFSVIDVKWRVCNLARAQSTHDTNLECNGPGWTMMNLGWSSFWDPKIPKARPVNRGPASRQVTLKLRFLGTFRMSAFALHVHRHGSQIRLGITDDVNCCTSSTAQGGGGSFKNRTPIGEVGWLWITDGKAKPLMDRKEIDVSSLSLSLSASFSHYLPTYLPIFVSIYLSLSISLSVCLFICLYLYLSIYLSNLSIYPSIHSSISLSLYLSISLSIYLSLSLSHLSLSICKLEKRSYSARPLQFLNLTTSKTNEFCETVRLLHFFELDKSGQHPKRSNSARLPHFLKLTTSKTNEFCETSFKKWKVERKADSLVPINAFCDFSSPPVESTAPATKKWCQVIRRAAPVTQNHFSKPEDLMRENATPLRKSAPWPRKSS